MSVTPEILRAAYAQGRFPMAQSRDDPTIRWIDPKRRGVLPLDGFHLSRSLRRHILRADVMVTVDRDFAGVLDACADRTETWINAEIRALYLALHDQGAAHALEVWQDQTLIGGVYGVVLGAAFFGESMFSKATDGSKIALAYLTDRLRLGGYLLFDTQFLTPHLQSLGAIEIPRADYHLQLTSALRRTANFDPPGYSVAAAGVLQRSTQTS